MSTTFAEQSDNGALKKAAGWGRPEDQEPFKEPQQLRV